MNTIDHLWQKFSELLLALLTIFFAVAAYRATYAAHADFAAAMLDNGKLVLGALLGLLTKAVMNRVTDTQNGDKTNGLVSKDRKGDSAGSDGIRTGADTATAGSTP